MTLPFLTVSRAVRSLVLCAGLWLACAVHAQPATSTPVPTTPPTATAGTADPDFSMSVTPPPALLRSGDHATLTAIVASIGGFDAPVTLSVQGDLPEWLVVSFSPATVTPIQPKPTWNGTISSAIYLDTSTVPYFYSSAGRPGREPMHALPVMAATGGPMLALLLLPAVRRRRRIAPLCGAAVLCVVPLMQGCGAGLYPNQVAAGTYTVTLQATTATGQTHVVPLLLRVSP